MRTAMLCPVCDSRLYSDGADGYICFTQRGCDSEWDTETLASTSRIRAVIPSRFYDDHVGRDLPSGVEARRTTRLVTVDLDRAGYKDLLADAEFYVEMGVAEFGRSATALIHSAEATVDALATVIPPAAR